MITEVFHIFKFCYLVCLPYGIEINGFMYFWYGSAIMM